MNIKPFPTPVADGFSEIAYNVGQLPLTSSLATLQADGSILYHSDEEDCVDAEFESNGVAECGENQFFISKNTETVEFGEMLLPLLGLVATLNSDGSIDYTTTEEATAPVSEGGPVASPSSFVVFPPIVFAKAS